MTIDIIPTNISQCNHFLHPLREILKTGQKKQLRKRLAERPCEIEQEGRAVPALQLYAAGYKMDLQEGGLWELRRGEMVIERFIRWAGKKYTVRQRSLALIAAGAVFLIGIPALLVWASALDQVFALPRLAREPFNTIAALILVLAGISLGIWSNLGLFDIGEGTPVPMMPTRRLVVAGPYRYCRNPMALAALCGYSGVTAYIGSPSAMAVLAVLAAALLIYIRLIEEKELEARFGQEYIEYKKKVPFIVPRRGMR